MAKRGDPLSFYRKFSEAMNWRIQRGRGAGGTKDAPPVEFSLADPMNMNILYVGVPS